MTIVLGAKEDAPWSTCFHPVKPLLDRSMETRQSVRGTFSSNTKLDHADIKSTKVLSILLKNVKSRRRRKTTHKYLRQRMIFSLLADLKKRFQFPEKIDRAYDAGTRYRDMVDSSLAGHHYLTDKTLRRN